MIDKKPSIDIKKYEYDYNRSEYYKSKISQFSNMNVSKLYLSKQTENSSLFNKSSNSFHKTSNTFFNNTQSSSFTGFNIARNLNEYPGMKHCNKIEAKSKKPKLKFFSSLLESN